MDKAVLGFTGSLILQIGTLIRLVYFTNQGELSNEYAPGCDAGRDFTASVPPTPFGPASENNA